MITKNMVQYSRRNDIMKKIAIFVLVLITLSTITFASGMTSIFTDGKTSTLDGQPQTVNNETYLPLTMVEEIFNKNISWNASTLTIGEPLTEVDITATVDGATQKALFYKSKTLNRPLIVFLHTWSSDYSTIYEYGGYVFSDEITSRDWNYIQPNFRGANNNPDACVSTKVISDIDDAINYAIANGNVDTSKIYIVGPSGGGLAALGHFMKSTRTDIKGYYVWVPITDLAAWYFQTFDKSYDNYFYDISNSLRCDGKLNFTEAQNRSPIYMTTPVGKLDNTFIKFYAGIRDGYDGAAVPFTHSVLMFNKLLKDKGLPNDRVPLNDVLYMVENHQPSVIQDLGTLTGGKTIKYKKTVGNLDLTLFDGAHEMIIEHAITDLENEINK
jgi:hypothetical protein